MWSVANVLAVSSRHEGRRTKMLVGHQGHLQHEYRSFQSFHEMSVVHLLSQIWRQGINTTQTQAEVAIRWWPDGKELSIGSQILYPANVIVHLCLSNKINMTFENESISQLVIIQRNHSNMPPEYARDGATKFWTLYDYIISPHFQLEAFASQCRST